MEDQGTKLLGEVTALLGQHDAALAAQDLKGVMKTYVSGNQIFLMGTGPGEIYRGREGIEGAYSQFFTKFEKGTAGFTYNWVSAGSRYDMAWFAAEYTIKGKVKDGMKEVAINVSGTLQKEKGKWRILAMHFSRLGVVDEPNP
jgi:uncharacterized protein (TIGR02246 family)